MVLSFLLYFYCRNHNLLTVGFMPVPPGHRQQVRPRRKSPPIHSLQKGGLLLPAAGKLQYRSKLSVEMKERYVWICGAYHLLLSPLEHVGSVTEGSNFMTEGSK